MYQYTHTHLHLAEYHAVLLPLTVHVIDFGRETFVCKRGMHHVIQKHWQKLDQPDCVHDHVSNKSMDL